MFGSDDHLDNAPSDALGRTIRAMFAGRGGETQRAALGKSAGRPDAPSGRGAAARRRGFQGRVCNLRLSGTELGVECRYVPSGGIHLKRKQPWVNHYAFHILDPDWGHVTIKVCPHPPFNVQVALNGHEYVGRQAERQNLAFQKEQNCFTETANLAELEEIVETLRLSGAAGRLIEVCERWLSTAC
jgi:hypothetical protein